jgi:hypothetical protein
MVKPQQPELRRSDRGATSDDATKERLTAPSVPGVDGPGDRLPEANQPGHHPDHEQDKPSGRDFVAKMHALAQEDDWVPPSAEDEVLDLTQLEGSSERAERLAHLAGLPFALAGKALERVRDRL